MSIIINLDSIMSEKKISIIELSERAGITNAQLSLLRNNKAESIKLSTLESICRELECQPGDVLKYIKE